MANARRLPRWISVLGAVVVSMAVVSGVGVAAGAADETGTISGAVVDGQGDPVSGSSVTAIRQGFPMVWLGATTQADGTYTVESVEPGRYLVLFTSSRTSYVDVEFYDGAKDPNGATAVVVGTGEAVTGIDAVVDPAGSISGRVVGPDGEPLAGIYVNAATVHVETRRPDMTAADGTFLIEDIRAGSWRVRASDMGLVNGLDTTYYGSTVMPLLSPLVVVEPGETTTGIEIRMLPLSDAPLFPDVPAGAPFFGVIEGAARNGIVAGYDDGLFRPTQGVTRQAAAAYLYRRSVAWGRLPGLVQFRPDAATFSDVPLSHPFALEIEWLAGWGFADGYPDGTFRPNGIVTRQALAAFLYRYSESPTVVLPSRPTFSDVPATHPFYREIEWAAASGITEGYSDGTFGPSRPISRQAMVAFLSRL